MGLPTAIYASMTSEQLEAYTLHLRIEEISQKLRINDVVPADGERFVDPPESRQHWLTQYQVPVASSTVRQLWTPCQHQGVPLPQAPRGRAPQVGRKGHEADSKLPPSLGLQETHKDTGKDLCTGQ